MPVERTFWGNQRNLNHDADSSPAGLPGPIEKTVKIIDSFDFLTYQPALGSTRDSAPPFRAPGIERALPCGYGVRPGG
jgi:hypothetical protein